MIAVDTSALIAVVLSESMAEACMAALAADDHLLISSGTVTEALIVASRRGKHDELASLIDSLGFTVVPLTNSSARDAAAAYQRWGKGFHAAALNFGDCFAYAVAKAYACPLLYVGNDFARTDIVSAM